MKIQASSPLPVAFIGALDAFEATASAMPFPNMVQEVLSFGTNGSTSRKPVSSVVNVCHQCGNIHPVVQSQVRPSDTRATSPTQPITDQHRHMGWSHKDSNIQVESNKMDKFCLETLTAAKRPGNHEQYVLQWCCMRSWTH